MKTVRLLFLLIWALAHIAPQAAAHSFQCAACAPVLPTLSAAAAEGQDQEEVAVGSLTLRSASVADRIVDLSHKATDSWRQFVYEWLANHEKMWIWMFLLLLLLARL